MIYTVLDQNYYFNDVKFKTIKKGNISLTVIDKGNGTGEIFNIISSDLKDYLNPKYAPGTQIKL